MGMSREKADRREEIRPLLKAANINPNSFLATDYINHFNEVFMLFEMIPDMPDIMEDIEAWAPKSYPDHFSDSAFKDKALAIKAYQVSPEKEIFDSIVDSLNAAIAESVETIRQSILENNPEKLAFECSTCITDMQEGFSALNKVIHSENANTSAEDTELWSQDEIDEILFN